MTRQVLTLACVLIAASGAVGCATGDDGGDDYVPSTGKDTGVATGDASDSGAAPVDSATLEDTSSGSDSATVDSTAVDTLVTDSGTIDTGSTPDTTVVDTGIVDTGTPDTGTDTGKADTGTPDTGTPDTGTPDTGTPDTGTPDTGTPDTGTPDTGPVCTVALSYDFEAGDQGFTHAPLSTFASDDPWARGTPSSGVTCHGGTKCWSTGLTGNYATCQTAYLLTPTIDLSSCAGSSKTVRLSFWHYYDYEAPTSGTYWDGGILQVSTNGTTWTDITASQAYDGTIKGSYSGCSPVPLVSGKSGWSGAIPGGAWKQVTYDIGSSYRVSGLRFRFVFGSDEATNKRGWFIDDVAVTAL